METPHWCGAASAHFLCIASVCLHAFADRGYIKEVAERGRSGPLHPGEAWVDALPELLAHTVMLSLYGLHLGKTRWLYNIRFDGGDGRTDWWRPEEGMRKDWLLTLRAPPRLISCCSRHTRCAPHTAAASDAVTAVSPRTELNVHPTHPQCGLGRVQASSYPGKTSGYPKTTGCSAAGDPGRTPRLRRRAGRGRSAPSR